jgi:hypothetical protein
MNTAKLYDLSQQRSGELLRPSGYKLVQSHPRLGRGRNEPVNFSRHGFPVWHLTVAKIVAPSGAILAHWGVVRRSQFFPDMQHGSVVRPYRIGQGNCVSNAIGYTKNNNQGDDAMRIP